nr:MAG TPA: hypothetical protein [Caudoviricetes sp.]
MIKLSKGSEAFAPYPFYKRLSINILITAKRVPISRTSRKP